jgi:hypothetical protein
MSKHTLPLPLTIHRSSASPRHSLFQQCLTQTSLEYYTGLWELLLHLTNTDFFPCPYSLQIQCNNYLYNIYIRLDIISNLEMIYRGCAQVVHKYHANRLCTNTWKLEHTQIMVFTGILEPIVHRCWGMTLLCKSW